MFEFVQDFVKLFERPIGRTYDNYALSFNLIQEEFREVEEQFDEYLLDNNTPDFEELTAELADLIYVCCYAAAVLDLPLNEVFLEKHQANLTKIGDDGKPILREDGKILKGPNYVPPSYSRFFNVEA